MSSKKDPRLARAGVSGYNKPKRTPSHPKKSHVIPSFIRRYEEASRENLKEIECWGSGSPRREFLYVDDLSEACRFVLENWKPKKEEIKFLNVGTGYDLPIKELAEIIAKKCQFKGKIKWDITKPDGTPRKQLDVSKIKKLGWKAKTNLDIGLENTIKEYKRLKEHNLIRE